MINIPKIYFSFNYYFISGIQYQFDNNVLDSKIFLDIDNSINVYYDNMKLIKNGKLININSSLLSKGEHNIYSVENLEEKQLIFNVK